jgi:hypothetical protein
MAYIGTKPADAVLETNDIADGIVTNPKLSTGSQQNFRNIIINGDMSIAQRGTSSTGLQNSPEYLIDRWSYRRAGTFTSATFSMAQSTDVPSGQGFAKSTKIDCTATESSLPADVFAGFNQRFEGQNLQYLKKGTSSAESLTASFWVKSNKTGTYILQLRDTDNSRAISKSYTISSADTWEKKTITFAGDTTGAFDNDANNSLEFFFYFSAGSDYTSGTLQTSWGSEVDANRAVGQVNLADSTSNEWYITGVQLEAGTTASSFETLPVDTQLKRCERYYETLTTGAQQAFGDACYYSSTNLYFSYQLKTTKRAVPSLDQVTGTNIYSFYRNNGADNFNGFDGISNRSTETAIEINCATNISGTGGQAGFLRTGNSATTAFIGFDAEL